MPATKALTARLASSPPTYVPPSVQWASKFPNKNNFTAVDTSRLLDIVGKVKPAGANEWVNVMFAYNDGIAPDAKRRYELLKGRFNKVRNHNIDGTFTKHLTKDHVAEARTIQAALEERAGVVVLNSSNDLDGDEQAGIIERRLPVLDDDWVAVAARYNARMESDDDHKTWQYLQRLYTEWKNVKKPTGDPTISDHIKRAKRAAFCISERVSDGDSLFEPESDNDDLDGPGPIDLRNGLPRGVEGEEEIAAAGGAVGKKVWEQHEAVVKQEIRDAAMPTSSTIQVDTSKKNNVVLAILFLLKVLDPVSLEVVKHKLDHMMEGRSSTSS
ncbi:hypothetical protein HK101_002982 [Irineochytrium annulatum]|nr:hypothetical protein HK101_002982 [Irineochytrium annulatum]